MTRHAIHIILLLALLSPVATASDQNPTIAFLRFGPSETNTLVENTVITTLQVYDFLDGNEREFLLQRQDLEGERLNIIFGDADNDLATVSTMVENALDRGADILVTMTTAVTQIAVNITLDQDQPTPVFFINVLYPYFAGIAEAPCIKPEHVVGIEIVEPFEDVFEIFQMQFPEMTRVGTLFSSTEASSAYGGQRVVEIGESLGFTVESAGITNISDMRHAAQGLVEKGVEAIILPLDYTVLAGLPIIATVADTNLIPLFYMSAGAVAQGALFGAGFEGFVSQSYNLGVMLSAWLRGELDLATTRIDGQSSMAVGVNFDAANQLQIEVAEALVERADIVFEDGSYTVSQDLALSTLREMGASQLALGAIGALAATGILSFSGHELPQFVVNSLVEGRKSEEFLEADKAYLASLQCTPELIAEQRAALQVVDD